MCVRVEGKGLKALSSFRLSPIIYSCDLEGVDGPRKLFAGPAGLVGVGASRRDAVGFLQLAAALAAVASPCSAVAKS